MKPRGVTVCVEYDDLLAITLPRNVVHFSECWVVTTPTDEKTLALCASVPGVQVFATDAFYAGGARFNKGLALERCFELMGRSGNFLIWDADTLFPHQMAIPQIRSDVLYGAPRLLLRDPKKWSPQFNWKHASQTRDRIGTGYFQLFDAVSPTISQLPWYDATFTHAGGGDGYFCARWQQKEWLPFNVLHLGPRDSNWLGRATPKLDGTIHPDAAKRAAEMQHYLQHAPWRGKQPTLFNEHVVVDGYQPTGYKTGSGKVE